VEFKFRFKKEKKKRKKKKERKKERKEKKKSENICASPRDYKNSRATIAGPHQ
jgi:hypothetical protein